MVDGQVPTDHPDHLVIAIAASNDPNSRFTGSDYHDESIEIARKRAADAGFANRISFEVASAADFSRCSASSAPAT